MRTEAICQAMGTAAQNVLETMFFTIPEGDAEMVGTGEPTLCARLNFSGDWSGEFTVQVPVNAAREIAANFAGALDPAEISDDKTGEVLSELANMVCGSTLGMLDRDKLFDLGSPRVSLESHSSLNMPAALRAFDLGNGATIVFSLAGEAVEA